MLRAPCVMPYARSRRVPPEQLIHGPVRQLPADARNLTPVAFGGDHHVQDAAEPLGHGDAFLPADSFQLGDHLAHQAGLDPQSRRQGRLVENQPGFVLAPGLPVPVSQSWQVARTVTYGNPVSTRATSSCFIAVP